MHLLQRSRSQYIRGLAKRLYSHCNVLIRSRQFYSLSKTHHPDHNPQDPNASHRFVAISEAYATLGSAEKRTRYDRDFLRTSAPSGPAPPGSHSSYSTPAGGRPASGLSRRRTQFRGPPPSFYRSGGWGTQGAKRAEHASQSSHAHEAGANQQETNEASGQGYPSEAPGTGPSGFTQGFDNDVPHFDREGHLRTHDAVLKSRHRARRKRGGGFEDVEAESRGTSALFSFVLLSGVLVTIFGVSGMFRDLGTAGTKKKREG